MTFGELAMLYGLVPVVEERNDLLAAGKNFVNLEKKG